MVAFVTDGRIGIDLTATTAGTTTDGAGAKYRLGGRVIANDASEWVYVQASGAIDINALVLVDETFQAAMCTTTLATEASGSSGNFLAFAQIAIADNGFAWVATKGVLVGRGLAGTIADRGLYTTASAGKMGITSTGVLINGVVFSTWATATPTANPIIAANPLNRQLTGLAS